MRATELFDVFLVIFIWAVITIFLWYLFKPHNYHSLRSVAILVLGDIGRSPRMMYHAQSFAENDFVTDIIGYRGSALTPALERLPRVKVQYLPEPPWVLQFLPFVIAAPIKVIHQVISILLVLLVYIEKTPEFLVVQNPPSIPTLALVQFVARIRGSKVIIDWHNLGYSILSLKLKENHIFVHISKWFEATFGYSAYAHLFVTFAMRDFLVKEWDIQGHKVVLHDRPPRHFHRSSAQETHELFRKIQPLLASNKGLSDFLPRFSAPYSTPFTHITSKNTTLVPGRHEAVLALQADRAVITSREGTPNPEALPNYAEIRSPTLRPDRPAILVSSTSWTPDENFKFLLEALGMYESRARELEAGREGCLPKLLAIVTGKGPMKEAYMEEVGILQKSWRWVRCISLWLETEDYPVLLGSADLGVSLHASSSGLDLPMKVVDMFGCGLPVCALNFACLNELVKDGTNGLVFNNAGELAKQLEDLLTGFPNCPKLASISRSLANTSQRSQSPNVRGTRRKAVDEEKARKWSSWEENWSSTVRPLVLPDMNL